MPRTKSRRSTPSSPSADSSRRPQPKGGAVGRRGKKGIKPGIKPRIKHGTKRGTRHGFGNGSASASLSALPTEALAAELRRRRSEIPRLVAEAARLRAALAEIEGRIAFLEQVGGAPAHGAGRAARPLASVKVVDSATSSAAAGSAATTSAKAPRKAGSRSRPRATRQGKPTLGERIVTLLGERNGVLSPREIAEAMGAQLGRAVNQSLLVHVSLTLRKLVNQGRIAQPGRGQYAVAGSPVAPTKVSADAA